MTESSRKNPTYSAPRRESIADHLEVLSWRTKWLRIRWRPKLASVSFVHDIVKKKIINGPAHRGGKSESVGVRSRFHPSDYRDLIMVIRLKSQGVTQRKAWKLHLWFRGREFDIAVIRAALLDEARKIVGAAMNELAPTGRFKGDFNRRVRRLAKSSGGKYDSLLGTMHALMARPSEIHNVDLDAAKMAELLCEDTDLSYADVLPITERLIDAIKSNSNHLEPDLQAALTDILRKTPAGRMVLQVFAAQPNSAESLERMRGVLADDRGKSRLLGMLQSAPDGALLRARAWRSFIRSAPLTLICEDFERRGIPRETTELFVFLIKSFRVAMAANPHSDVLFFLYLVDDEIPFEAPDLGKGAIDADAVLQFLRRQRSRNVASSKVGGATI